MTSSRSGEVVAIDFGSGSERPLVMMRPELPDLARFEKALREAGVALLELHYLPAASNTCYLLVKKNDRLIRVVFDPHSSVVALHLQRDQFRWDEVSVAPLDDGWVEAIVQRLDQV